MNDEHILHIKEAYDTDESIRRYEHIEYQPVTGTNLNTTGEIRIIIESQDEVFHPSNSYLLIEGQLLDSTTSNAYALNTKIALVNNGPLFLLSNIKYELSGHEIESINYPGPATLMKGLLTLSDDFAKGQGMNQCWAIDTSDTADETANAGFKTRQDYIIDSSVPRGTFSFVIPLKHIFGFAEDYDKVTYGLRHVLTMVRQSDNDAIFKAAAVNDGKVTLSKVSWFMPRVLPNDQERLKLMKTIEDKSSVTAAFRMLQCDTITVPQSTSFSWRLSVRTSPECPRWIIIGFQTGRANNQDKNPAAFEHCGATNVWAELNGNPYPNLQYNSDFDKLQIATAYNAIPDFLSSYYGMAHTQPSISPVNFKSLYPLHVIDISKQPERIKYGVMDLNLRATFKAAVAAGTQAYAVVISDRILNFQSDGSKMSVTL